MAPSSSLPPKAAYWIDKLQLKPHPEGGYYKEITRGNWVTQNAQGEHRFAYTTIYFLLTADSPSHFHRLEADEVWVHNAGDPIDVHVILEQHDDEALLRSEDPPLDPSPLPLHDSYIPSDILAQRMTQRRRPYAVYRCVTVGARPDGSSDAGREVCLQYTVPRRAIFGSTLSTAASGGKAEGFTLVSCIVAPGFSFKDFEVFTQADLMAICPEHETIIRQLAYEKLPG